MPEKLEHEITPREMYLDRRTLMRGGLLAATAAGTALLYKKLNGVDLDTTKGVAILRHLAEAEMEDAVRPDEFRQMFSAAHDAAHPNLAATLEVLDINGRPAVLQEWLTGLPSPDWPTDAAIPGVWVKLLSDAAKGLDAAHRQGLTHGRLSSDTFLMTANGTVKLLGIGEPMWLSTGIAAAFDPTPEADLRAIGQIAFGWSQLGQPPGKRRTRAKAFPESLMAVVRPGKALAIPEHEVPRGVFDPHARQASPWGFIAKS